MYSPNFELQTHAVQPTQTEVSKSVQFGVKPYRCFPVSHGGVSHQTVQ